jgi:cytochrome c556
MRRIAMMLGAMVLGVVLVGTGSAPAGAEQGMSEADYDALMKRVGPAFGGLRKSIEATAMEPAAEQAAVLRQAFTEAEAFWKARAKGDAVEWAAGARKTVEATDEQVKAGNWEAAGKTAGELQSYCQQCHGAYREKAEDGSWRIKPGN